MWLYWCLRLDLKARHSSFNHARLIFFCVSNVDFVIHNYSVIVLYNWKQIESNRSLFQLSFILLENRLKTSFYTSDKTYQ